MIDTNTPDEVCSAFLRDTLHEGAATFNRDAEDSDSAEDTPDPGKTCFSCFGGLCQKTPHLSVLQKLVKSFNRALLDHNVRVGNLLHIVSGADSFLGFLGVCLQRPTLHTLIQGKLQDNGSVILDKPAGGHPSIITSHMLFQRLVSQLKPWDPIKVEVWDYNLFFRDHRITIEAVGTFNALTVDPKKPMRTRKPHCKLPFGLKIPKKESKQRKRHRGPRQKHTKKQAKAKVAVENVEGSTDSDTDSILDLDSTAHDDSVIQENREAEAQENREAEADNVYPVTTEAHHQEAEAQQLIFEHELTKNAADQKDVKSSFFAKQTGLDDIAIAVSSRAKCFYCKSQIAKGDVRFSWYHNTKRPSVWVHAGCLPGVANRDQHTAQVIQRLHSLRPSPASSTVEQSEQFEMAVRAALEALQSSGSGTTVN